MTFVKDICTPSLTCTDTNEDADHRYLMFSATFPKTARSLAREYMVQEYVRIRVGRAGSSHKNVHQDIIWVDDNVKQRAIFDLIQSREPGLIIIFCYVSCLVFAP